MSLTIVTAPHEALRTMAVNVHNIDMGIGDCEHCDTTRIEPVETSAYPPEPCSVCRSGDTPAGKLGREMLRLIDKIGIGLAANQVGIPIRLIVTAVPGFEPEIMCNPEIVWKKGLAFAEEGCLSEPGKRVRVPRATKIRIAYRKTDGTAVEQTFQNHLFARCIQHEIEHLDGKLISDYQLKAA